MNIQKTFCSVANKKNPNKLKNYMFCIVQVGCPLLVHIDLPLAVVHNDLPLAVIHIDLPLAKSSSSCWLLATSGLELNCTVFLTQKCMQQVSDLFTKRYSLKMCVQFHFKPDLLHTIYVQLYNLRIMCDCFKSLTS